jgi:hypothetical protein
VALIAGKRWQALLAMIASAFGFALLSGLVFGFETWVAFFQTVSHSTRFIMEGEGPWEKMPSIFAAVRSVGGSSLMAWFLQGMVMIGTTATVAWIWLRGGSPTIRNAALALGILLFPMYVFNYDLAILALPLAWLSWEGYARGWRPFEPCVLMLGWAMPLFLIPTKGKLVDFPLGPLILVSLLLVVIWRQWRLDG